MDASDDTSLIEISEEDDSLLSSPLLRNDAASASPPSAFACSPLVRFPRPPHPGSSSSRRRQLPPLPPGGGGEEGCKPGSCSSSASKDGAGKENDEVNRLEAGKLSLEPQQMKRKKKGAGFNLRKSLAWNRAFFTEEGVLDPSELSMLSGDLGDSTGLSTIHEGRESLCSGSDATNCSSLIEGRKLAGTMSPKPGSATRDKLGSVAAAKRKVIPSPDANKSVSKRGGYPPPMALSSLRKPSTEGMTNVVNKGSKISRLFTSKPVPAIASVSRSHTVSASQLKKNQIVKSVSIQRNAAAKITSASVKAAQGNVKCGPSSNSTRKSIEQSKRNVVRSGSSTNVRHQIANQTTDKEAKVRDVLLHPAACSPNVADVCVLKTVKSFSQNATNAQHTQPQPAKPSGLRMPSPSLGYFGQSKTSGSQSLPQRTQLCNLQQSGVPTSTSAGVLKTTQLRLPLPRKELDHSSTGSLAPSIANPVLHGNAKCNVQSDVTRNLEIEDRSSSKSLKCNAMVHDVTSNIKLQNFDQGQPSNDGNVSDTEAQVPLSNLHNGITKLSKLDLDDNERIATADFQQRSTELISDHPTVTPHLSLQAEIEVLSETQTMTSSQEVNPLFHNLASNRCVISSEVQFGNVNCDIDKNTSKVPENRSCSLHDGNKKLQEQAETKPSVYADTEELKTEKESLKAADGSRTHDLENLPDCLSFCKGAEEVKDVADKADHLSKALQVRDAKVQAIDFVAPVESSKNGLHTLNDDMSCSLLDDSNQERAEKSELHNAFCVMKQTSFSDHVSSTNTCLLPERSSSSKPSIEDDVIQSVISVPKTFAHGDGLTDCSIDCQEAYFKRDSGLDMAVKVHQINHEVKEVAIEALRHDIEHQGDSGSMLLDCEGQVLHTIPSCRMDLTEVCLNSEHSMESDLGNSDLNSKFTPLMHVEAVSKFNERNEHELFLDKQVNHYDSQPRSSYCSSGSITSMVPTGCFIETWNKDEESVEAGQSQGSYNNQIFEDIKSTEDAAGSFTENFTDFVEACEVSQSIIDKHENNRVEAEHVAKEKGMEDNRFQFSDVRPKDDFGISISAVKSKSPMVVQGTSGSFQEGPETQIFNLVTEKPSIMNQDVLSDDDLSSMDISSTESEDSFSCTDSVIQATVLNSSDQSIELVTGDMSLMNHYIHLDEKLECSDTSPREALVSDGYADAVLDIKVPPAVHSSDLAMGENASNQNMLAEDLCSPDLEPSLENDPCSNVCKSDNHSECREHDTSLELDSSLKKPGPLIQVAEDSGTCNLPCSSSIEVESFKSNAISNGDFQQGEAQLPNSSISSQETIRMMQNSNNQLLHKLASAMFTEEDKDETSEMCKPENDGKKGAVTIKPPPDAVPFSDEWLAAFEAAGEEILTMKSGAVQNSPPDKSIPEPSPWSPVRRKNNQEIGPFDCTKFGKTDAPSSAGS